MQYMYSFAPVLARTSYREDKSNFAKKGETTSCFTL